MKYPEYDQMDAVALAQQVREKAVSPQELLEAAVERIDARNPALNAIVHSMVDRANQRVGGLPDGPLKGVPMLVKDLKLQIEGQPTSNATKLSKGKLSQASSVLAQRYEAAGAQILGKTNTPEFGIMGITEPELWGPTRNPWNLDHTPGGSSGGSAASVAARIVPIAHGGDGGGSIRIPASCCGLFGLKPTRGRVTMSPFAGEAWGGFVQEHVLTRSVRDSAAVLDLVDAPTPGEPYVAPAKRRPFLEEVGADPGKLKIAFTRDPLYADETHPDCAKAVEEAAILLEELGHEVIEERPDFPREEMVTAYFLTVAAGVARFVELAAESAGRKPRPSDFEPSTWLLALIAWKTTAPELIAAQQAMHKVGRDVGAFFERYDLFLTSTMARPPAKVEESAIQPSERLQLGLLRKMPLKVLLRIALGKMGSDKLAYTPNTQLFNQTGQPGASIPLHWNEAGLPIGVQLVSKLGDEATILRVAAQLETARPWADRTPPGV